MVKKKRDFTSAELQSQPQQYKRFKQSENQHFPPPTQQYLPQLDFKRALVNNQKTQKNVPLQKTLTTTTFQTSI